MIKNKVSDTAFLLSLYRDIWWNASSDFELSMPIKSYVEKKNNEKILNKTMDDLIKNISTFPKEPKLRDSWKEKTITSLNNFIFNQPTLQLGLIDERFKKEILKSTKQFIINAKEFDGTISYKDIGQALRNVWIVNIFQNIVNEKVKFTKSIFGYSMLYPYTDNYIDDPLISFNDKHSFNNRFTKKLNGEHISPINSHEEKVYRLVEFIESDFNRVTFPNVYHTLLLIHQGQKNSLIQQEGISIPYEKDILNISIEKGGASVLADGYLIRGALTKEEEIFAYGYGFLLQLCDDLQDVTIDIENNHMTIMSQIASKYPLDAIASKLINLTINVVDNSKCFISSNSEELKKLIKNNCIYLILFAITSNRKYFSKEYIKTIEPFLPFTFKYIDNLKHSMQKRFKKLNSTYHDVLLEDIFMYLLD